MNRFILSGLILVIGLSFFLACSSNGTKKKKESSPELKTDLAYPLKLRIQKPIHVLPDTCRPAIRSAIMKKPETGPADFAFKMENYTTDNGLALDAIKFSILDKMGNLWFSTGGGGVSRYDGKSFTNFTVSQGLADNNVFCIAEDKTGDLWFGTLEGASRYDGKSFINYTTAQGLENNAVISILEDKMGKIWFGIDGGGISRYDGLVGKQFTNYTASQGLISNSVRGLAEDKMGNLWIGTLAGVSRFDGKSFFNFTTDQGLASNEVISVFGDKAGNTWFGTRGAGVSRYDGISFTNFTTSQGLVDNTVFRIAEDKRDNIWFGTNGGLSRYDGTFFTNYTTSQGLANNLVSSITSDNAGSMWFGTYGGGISRYDGESFVNFNRSKEMNGIVMGIAEDKAGNFWFGTDRGGVSFYDGTSFTNYNTDQGLLNNTIMSIMEDRKGNLWFGTNGGGVSLYDGTSFINYTTAQGLVNNVVRAIVEDKKGNIWFGTGRGLSRYDGKSFTNYTTDQGLVSNKVMCIREDHTGNLWIGTSAGLSLYQDGQNSGGGSGLSAGEHFTNYTVSQGLANNSVWSVTEDERGTVWIATDGGMSRYDGTSFANFDKSLGLPDNTITQIVVTKEKNLAIGTNFGIAVLVDFKSILQGKKALDNIPPLNSFSNKVLKKYSPVFEIYNSATGYPVKDVNVMQNSMLKDSKGMIWIGTGSNKTGLVRFDYSALNKSNKPPQVFIQSVKINNTTICWYDLMFNSKSNRPRPTDSLSEKLDSVLLAQQEIISFGKKLTQTERDSFTKSFAGIKFDSISRFYPVPQNLVLSHQNNYISFEFVALELARPYLVNYQYMLEGYDKDWSPLVKKTSATFGNVYEGSYTFKLRAQSPEGIWSEPIVYTFKVLPPWYRSWWFIFIYLLAGVATVIIIIRLRTTKLRKDKVFLERLVKDRTMEITDSIEYARHIQESMFLTDEAIKLMFPFEYFLFFQPKDIVSGDFYWLSTSVEDGSPLYIIASVDCTGHGVPGAFMSMIGNMLLNKIVNEKKIADPALILKEIQDGIFESFHRKDTYGIAQGGMDISICVIKPDKKVIQYAGAMNPIYVLRTDPNSGEMNIEVIKAAYFSIGDDAIVWNDNIKREVSFVNQNIPIENGMSVYLFTDGYLDQFNAVHKQRFGSKRFKEHLIKYAKLPMHLQKQNLMKEFENWKGSGKQIDDILVIGIQF
jgi:ligand-binding sensor domain-containing protein/serine phosphatase RsbU (regulator of sigma subunit)